MSVNSITGGVNRVWQLMLPNKTSSNRKSNPEEDGHWELGCVGAIKAVVSVQGETGLIKGCL